jgi:hypothetical protein
VHTNPPKRRTKRKHSTKIIQGVKRLIDRAHTAHK